MARSSVNDWDFEKYLLVDVLNCNIPIASSQLLEQIFLAICTWISTISSPQPATVDFVSP